ncbi:hypothetical protein L1049_008536 [Liquidambar formosana]|uniref:Disease resistance protein At4g27190-like leucine-rich repeats domain-containing protein n=1 Tax=Liquidambar formosana TaxID=63359 RepID=A0AAP0S4E6_LIQFO
MEDRRRLEIVSPRVIKSLIRLEELYLKDNGLKWVVEEGKAQNEVTLAELGSLSDLRALVSHLPTTKFSGYTNLLDKLVRFRLYSNDKYIYFDNEFHNFLQLHDTDATILADGGTKVLLKKTNRLEIRGVRGMKNVLNNQTRGSFVHLENLELLNDDDDDDGPEYLIDIDLVPQSVFPSLKSLWISHVSKLKMISHGQLPKGSFGELRGLRLEYLPNLTNLWKDLTQFVSLSNLKRIRLTNCDRLENLFSPYTARSLVQLQYLEIETCDEIKEIVATERGGHEEVTNKIRFLKLSELKLERLPSLIYFYEKMDEIEFPQLSTLSLRNLRELTSFYPNSQDSGGNHDTATQHLSIQKVKSMCELRYMDVLRCKKLLNVFSSSLVQGLQNLEDLEVQECDLLEVVFDFEGVSIEEGRAALVLPCLKKLYLRYLPRLTHLWKKAPQEIQGFQNLQSLVVDYCWELKYIFTPSIAKLLVKLENLRISNCAIVEFVGKDQEGSKENKEATNIIVFPMVKHLNLQNLPDLMSFKWPVLKESSLRNADVKVFTPAILGAQKQRTINVRSHEEVQEQQITFEDEDSLFQCNKLSNAVSLNLLSSFQSLSILHVRGCKSLRNLFSPSMVKSVEQLQELEISECEMMTTIVAEDEEGDEKAMDKVEFPQLRRLELWELPNLVSFFPKVNTGEIRPESNLHTRIQHLFNEKVAFPSLEELRLTSVSKLDEIWCKMDHEGTIGFQNLKSLSFFDCGNLRNVFYPSMARGLVQLQYLDISYCEKIKEIVVNGENKEEDRMDKIVIEGLTSFCQGPYPFDLPSLKHVLFPSLEKLILFQRLRLVKVERYGSLRNLFSPLVAKGLVCLEKLLIEHCDMMEEIISKGEEEEEERMNTIMVIPQLKCLELYHLPNLISFCQGRYAFDLPSLVDVFVFDCPKMKTFSSEFVSTKGLKQVLFQRKEFEYNSANSSDEEDWFFQGQCGRPPYKVTITTPS